MSLLDRFLRSRSQSAHTPAAHMTWASRSIATSLNTTRRFLKRQIWAWPIIAVALLGAIHLGVTRAIESTMKANLASELETLRDVETAMLVQWLATQERNAESMANDATTRRIATELFEQVKPGGDPAKAELLRQELADSLASTMSSHGYIGFALGDRTKTIQAASEAELIGTTTPPQYDSFFAKVRDGVTTVTPPFASIAAIKDQEGRTQTGVPTMFVAAPVRDENFQVIATLAFRLSPEKDFTRILHLGRFGDTGETYAFNKTGLMLSESRYNENLMLLGVLPEEESPRSMLKLLIRDPGGDMTEGYRPMQRRSRLPVTLPVKSAPDGPGVDVEGYRGYRGVERVGAWTWLEKYGYGLVSEQNVAEAFRPLNILKRTFRVLLGLLILSSIAIFFFTVRMARLQRQAREATIEAKQLGQYKLEQKLGAGAMGVVYKGSHAMLRRPTAIKLLDADKVSDEATARFEREVQITSLLTHPNTVAIYDYGRTPEGVFYYAMEYLEGINLQTLVDKYGPLPPARVIHFLRQVCGSLYEAHSMGLVHRDIKPANLMVTRRGGEPDVMKVLDFGLVKARDEYSGAPTGDDHEAMAGTPLYMSPEAIQMPGSVDGCSDIYAVGAVGYFLLTGRTVFEAANVVELCEKHISETPVPPSVRSGREIPADLESALLACLEKSRARRPQTARDLAQRLARCAAAGGWTIDDSETWWSRHERGQHAVTDIQLNVGSTGGGAFDATVAL